MNTDILILSGWSIEVPPASLAARQAVLDALASVDPAGPIPDGEVGQMIADGLAAEMAAAETWMKEVEEISMALRKPYREHADKIKATSDGHVLPVAQKWQQLGRKLSDFEAGKIRAELAVNRQRMEEAQAVLNKRLEAVNNMAKTECAAVVEAARQEAMSFAAPQLFVAPKTAGVNSKVSYDYQVTNQREFAEWCWANGKAFVNEVTFFRGDIIAYLNSEGADRNIPGLYVSQGVETKTKRGRKAKVLDVGTRVEL